jgi:hypothetical protein
MHASLPKIFFEKNISIMHSDLLNSFLHHLDLLKKEIDQYPNDESLWVVAEGISNSGGNLCRHLTGNLNHFIGHALGNTGYVRDRPLEFDIKGLPKTQLIQDIENAKKLLSKVLPPLNLMDDYPPEMWGVEMTVQQSLIKLLTHFTYHLGQINYHRRLLAK